MIIELISIIIALLITICIAIITLKDSGWRFGLYPNIRYVGLKDAKIGAVLSSTCEIVPRSGRIALNIGLFLWLVSLKAEYTRPDTSQPDLPL